MPTFAELRAKAEAAAQSAKETANHKLEHYRGEDKHEAPISKPPPRRPAVKPPIPTASRPVKGVEENVAMDDGLTSEGIETLIQNKAVFFQFLDEVRVG